MNTAIQPLSDANLRGPTALRQLTEDILELSSRELSETEFFREFLQKIVQGLLAGQGWIWRKQVEPALSLISRFPADDPPWRLSTRDAEQRQEILHRAASLSENHGDAVQDLEVFPAVHVRWNLLFVPISIQQRPEAVLEIWLGPNRSLEALPGIRQYLVRLAQFASIFLTRKQLEPPNDPQLWSRLDAFTQRIHTSLDLADVSLKVVNEGQQLLGCDRVSLAMKRGRNVAIEAVSGTDQVEPRANLIRRLAALSQEVFCWGEKLVYLGERDRSLPPEVLKKLDEYVEISFSKLLILYPLPDPRETERKRPARSLLIVENFTKSHDAAKLDDRLKVLSPHMAPALYNADRFRQLPLGWIWKPLAAVREGLASKTRYIVWSVTALLVLLILGLTLIPYPLRMDAKGQLLPQHRRWVYAPVEGQIVRFEEGIASGSKVAEDQTLMRMHDLQLESRMLQLNADIQSAQNDIETNIKLFSASTNEGDRIRLSADRRQKEAMRDRYSFELRALCERTHADRTHPGFFWLKAPVAGTVLSWDFREKLTHRLVKPHEPLIRIGDKSGPWEVELRIPQKNMGHVIRAFRDNGQKELDVDLLLVSNPTRIYKAKLSLNKLAGEAQPLKEQPTEIEPVVLASARIDGPDIPDDQRITPELLVAGTDVNVRIRCGHRAMGYSLFYGVWEFCYERIWFFF